MAAKPAGPLRISAGGGGSGHSESDKTRVRIQAIDISLRTSPSKYPIVLQILVDNDILQYRRLEKDRPLHWDADIAFAVTPKSTVQVRVREKHTHWSTTLGSFSFSGEDVLQRWSGVPDGNRELKKSKQKVDITIKLSPPTSAVSIDFSRAAVEKAADATKESQSLLSKHREVWSAVKTIRDVVEKLAEIHPIAKATFVVVNGALQLIEEQKAFDSNIRDLTVNMADMLPAVEVVGEYARIESLQQTVGQVLKLIEDASTFITQHLSQSHFGRAISSNARETIDGFIEEFKVLEKKFDRGVTVQEFTTTHTAQEESILDKLRSIVARCGPSYDVQRVCMDGTRLKILQDIDQWAVDIIASPPLLWITGLAGVGKSSIASSVAQRLHNLQEGSRLGATFFCRRDDPYLRDPNLVIPRISSRLASIHKPFGKAVAAALQAEPDLPMEAIPLQFKGLIKSPLEKVRAPIFERPLVVVVDAVDECGTSDATRRQLLFVLHEMAGLASWLKVILTSRPDPDIRQFFDTLGTGYRRVDLDQEDPYEDILTFATRRMAEIAQGSPLLSPMWPGPEITAKFANRAGRLFIWARVASDFIANAVDVQHNLEVILAEQPGVAGPGPHEHLDALYKTALKHNIRDNEHGIAIFRTVIGTVVAVVTRDPLSAEALKALMEGEGVPPHALDKTIRSLHSVLYEDAQHNNVIRLCHPSFMDFLTNPLRCPKEFFINLGQHNANVACMCLRTMNSGLHFNICGLESTPQFNVDIVDLKDRVDRAISRALGYSCVHWHSHLGNALKEEQAHMRISKLLGNFFSGPRLLYWLEALSLLGALRSAISGLMRVVKWLESGEHEYSRFAADMLRFVSAFYEPMSLSAPHIYISALPFAPQCSIVSERLHHLFPGTIRVIAGQERHWSAYLHTSQAHTQSVTSVAFSPDGLRIASGSHDNTIRLWDAETGEAISVPLEGHTEPVNSVAFSLDSRRIVSGSQDKTIRIWDAQTGADLSSSLEALTRGNDSVSFSLGGQQGSHGITVRVWDADTGAVVAVPLEGHTESVTSVAFSPDGQQIVSGSDDHTLRIWDAEAGTQASILLEGHTGPVSSVAFSPDGRQIVSGSEDHTIRVWDAETGTEISNPLEAGVVTSVAFSLDGRRIVSGSQDTIRIWDAETSADVLSPLKGNTRGVGSGAFSLGGQQILSGSHGITVRIWDADGAAVSFPLEGHTGSVTCVAFSPDGRWIVSGSDDQTIRIWDVEEGDEAFSPLEGHTGPVNSVAFSPDGRRIVSGSHDHTVRIWDVAAPPGEAVAEVSSSLIGHSQSVSSVATFLDGRRMPSHSQNRLTQSLDAETSTEASSLLRGHSRGVNCVAFSPDNQWIVSGSHDNTVCIWDAETGAAVSIPLRGHISAVSCVIFSPDGKRIASGSFDTTIRIWDAETGALVCSPCRGHAWEIEAMAFSPDGRRIVSGSHDTTIRIWDTETGTEVSSLLKDNASSVKLVAFSLDSRQIISVLRDNAVRLWDAETGAAVRFLLEGHTAITCSVAYSLDGRWIVSGSDDHTVQIWNARTGEAFSIPFEGHTGAVLSVAFSPDGQRIVSGSNDHTLRIWDAQTGRQVSSLLEGHTGPVNSVTFSPDGRWIVSGSDDKTIRIWDAETGRTHHAGQVDKSALSPDGHPTFLGLCDTPIRTRKSSFNTRKLAEPVDNDGWIRYSKNALLWVPVQYRHGLVDQCVMSIPSDASIVIDCGDGTSWTTWQG